MNNYITKKHHHLIKQAYTKNLSADEWRKSLDKWLDLRDLPKKNDKK